jgi:hypothetical protein
MPGNRRIAKKENVCPYRDSVIDILSIVCVGIPMKMILLPLFEKQA